MDLSPLTPDVAAELGVSRNLRGLVVQDIDPDSAAADKGLAPGDVIVEANQSAVSTLDDLQASIAQARDAGRQQVLLRVRRGGEPRFVALPLN